MGQALRGTAMEEGGTGRFLRRVLPMRLQDHLGLASAVDPFDLPLGHKGHREESRVGTQESGASSSSGARTIGFTQQDFRELGMDKIVQAMVDRRSFNTFMGCVILVNLVSIGVETDVIDSTAREVVSHINGLFLLAYVGEIVLRLLTHGPDAMKDKLTVMDIVLVTVAFVERYVSNSGFARALPAFRLLRVLRLLQQTKMLRDQRELWVLVVSGSHTVLTLGWMSCILFVAILGCSSFTKYVIGNSAAWVGTMDPRVRHEPFEPFDNHEYFGSVSRSFMTMLQFVTLSGWADIARRVTLVYPLLFIFFFVFAGVTAYGITIVVVSNIVEDCLAAARAAEAAGLELSRENRNRWGDEAGKLLRLVDKDGDGDVYPEEVEKALSRTGLRAILNALEVPDLDGHSFVRIFDHAGCGRAGIDELVSGFVIMGEDVRPKDFVKLNLWVAGLLMRAKALSMKFGTLSAKVAELRVTLEKAFDAMDYYQHTKEVNELRHRAIKEIRSAPPPEVPKLREWKPPYVPKYPPEDQAKIFMNITGRFMGINGRAPAEGDMPGARKAELPPPPMRFWKEQQRALAEEAQYVDKYWPTPNPESGMLGPSPSLAEMKAVLGAPIPRET